MCCLSGRALNSPLYPYHKEFRPLNSSLDFLLIKPCFSLHFLYFLLPNNPVIWLCNIFFYPFLQMKLICLRSHINKSDTRIVTLSSLGCLCGPLLWYTFFFLFFLSSFLSFFLFSLKVLFRGHFSVQRHIQPVHFLPVKKDNAFLPSGIISFLRR